LPNRNPNITPHAIPAAPPPKNPVMGESCSIGFPTNAINAVTTTGASMIAKNIVQRSLNGFVIGAAFETFLFPAGANVSGHAAPQ
jgi:hypothetical protein